MRLLIIVVALLLGLCCGARAAPTGDDALANLVVLCYHDVRESLPLQGSSYVMETGELVNQFAWLKENRYTVVSLQQVLDAQAGRAALPAKPVLLTFDDGYRGFRTHIYPLLRLFEYPAVLALVTRWIDDPMRGEADAPAQATMLTWDEVRDIARDGLVEIASHSHDLHRAVRGNPQGSLFAAATARTYDPAARTYEADADYEQRLRADLARSAELIARHTGTRPRAIVWPYGGYNLVSRRIARELGMPVSLGLDERPASGWPFGLHLGRTLVAGNPGLRQFMEIMLKPYQPDPVRAVRIRLDDVFDTDSERQEAKLSQLVERIAALGINTVYLGASADTDGDGHPDSVYFPSSRLPMRADLFGRVSWQLHTRAGVHVFAWLPTTGYRWPGQDAAENRRAGTDERERRDVGELFQDLARHAPFDGLLFDDADVPDGDSAGLAFADELVRAVARYRVPPRTARAFSAADAVMSAVHDDVLRSAGQRHDHFLLRASARADDANRLGAGPTAASARIVVELPAATRDLAQRMRALERAGVAGLAYDHDDFLHDRPALREVRPVMSLQSGPK